MKRQIGQIRRMEIIFQIIHESRFTKYDVDVKCGG